MIIFERTRDLDLVAAIMTHSLIYPWIADDFYPAPENFRPNDSEAVHYLLSFDEAQRKELLGVFITYPVNQLLWMVDHALLPHSWGSRERSTARSGARALEIGRAFEEWLWTFTPATKAVGLTPSCNKLALRYARRAGMTEVGRISRCYQRQFELHDLVIFEKEKGS